MKRIIPILLLLLTSTIFADSGEANRRPDKIKVSEVNLTAIVTEIDVDSREVTLATPEGAVVTLNASDEVQRLDEVEVGDVVVVVYKTLIKAEFRDPTPEERENPLVVLSEEERASEFEDPGAFEGSIVRAVVTIKQIILDSQLVTIKGPHGKYTTFPVEDKVLLRQLKVGELVILTYAEAVIITLQKTEE
jgi:hypothetical protein